MNNEFKFEQFKEDDFSEIEILAKESGGNIHLNPSRIKHQYFDNPSQSFSLWKVVKDNKIEGFATTNNFNFLLQGKNISVGMPQNVLVSESSRGKGLFGQLYNLTERENIVEKGIDTFLTFTNSMSTPIFLSKFGYSNGQCPNLIFYISTIIFSKKDIKYSCLNNVSELALYTLDDISQPDNSITKNKGYFLWRYKLYEEKNLRILKIQSGEKLIGFAILKVEKKKRVSFLLLMDVIQLSNNCMFEIINACRNYCARNMFVGLLLFKFSNASYPNSILKLTFKDRFNFLVKGKSKFDTTELSKIEFNFCLGDMDSL